MSVAKRFWSKVDKRGPDDCWPWTAAVDTSGYGKVWTPRGPTRAPRMAFAILAGVMPNSSQHVLHSCDNRLCVNPSHLSLGTNAENMRQMAFRDRSTYGERSARAKLTEATVRIMRHQYASGSTLNELVTVHDVSQTTVRYAVSGITWARVPGAVQMRPKGYRRS